MLVRTQSCPGRLCSLMSYKHHLSNDFRHEGDSFAPLSFVEEGLHGSRFVSSKSCISLVSMGTCVTSSSPFKKAKVASSHLIPEDMVVLTLSFLPVEDLRFAPSVCVSLFNKDVVARACVERALTLLPKESWPERAQFHSWPEWMAEVEFHRKQRDTIKSCEGSRVSAGSSEEMVYKNLVLTESGTVRSIVGAGFNATLRGGLPHQRRLLGRTTSFDHCSKATDKNSSQEPARLALSRVVASFDRPRIVQVSVGDYHALLLNEEGSVFSFGDGYSGQLGHGDTEDVSRPTEIRDFGRSKRCLQVSAGSLHSLVLVDNGEVYSFGQGRFGRLGLGDQSMRTTPGLVTSLVGYRVEQISAGNTHSLALVSSDKENEKFTRELYSWGGGRFGKLGHGDERNQHVPQRVKSLIGVSLSQISAGGFHSLALEMAVTESDSRVYSWGFGADGQLGHGDVECTNRYVPTVIKALNKKKISKVSAGSDHSLVLSLTTGNLYSFGEGSDGQLGHGDRSQQIKPVMISQLQKNAKGRPTEIAAGCTNNLVLTEFGEVYRWGTEVVDVDAAQEAAEEVGDEDLLINPDPFNIDQDGDDDAVMAVQLLPTLVACTIELP
eukprot:g5146.t1